MQNKRITRLVAALLILAMVLSGCSLFQKAPVTSSAQRVTNYTGLAVDTPTGSTTDALVVNQVGTGDIVDFQDNGTSVWTIADGGAITGGTAGQTWTLAADALLLVDGATTANTGTAGIVDINHGSITANASAVNIASTVNTGATGAADQFGMVMTLTNNDADADQFGISITAAATAVGGAASYEAGLVYDCAENTAAACIDGVRLTAGTATGMTDGVDASDADIDNAINIGANLIMGTDDSLSVGATDDTVILDSNDSDGTYTCTDADVNAGCTFAAGGTGNTVLGSATSTSVNVLGVAVDLDITGGMSLDADLASNISTAAGDITVDAEAGSVVIIGSEAAADSISLDANDTVTSGLTVVVGSVSGMSVDGGLTDFGGGTCGVADGDNDVCIAADLEVDNELEVDGSIDLDGTVMDADVSGAISLDADTASNFSVSGASVDLTFESELGSVVVKGDEAVATAITLDANDAVTTGITIQVGSVSGLTVDGGVTNIGGGTPGNAAGDNDLYVTADFEVDGASYLEGDVTIAAGDLTISNGLFLPNFDDLTVNDGDWITPTTINVYALDSGGAVTITLGACTNEGQSLMLIGDDGNDIIINDANIRTSTCNALTINQYDIVAWVCQDAEWLELYIITNS